MTSYLYLCFFIISDYILFRNVCPARPNVAATCTKNIKYLRYNSLPCLKVS